jgi:flagellar basal body-associated protein FliL
MMWIYIIVIAVVIGGLVWWLMKRGKDASGPSSPADNGGQQPPNPAV